MKKLSLLALGAVLISLCTSFISINKTSTAKRNVLKIVSSEQLQPLENAFELMHISGKNHQHMFLHAYQVTDHTIYLNGKIGFGALTSREVELRVHNKANWASLRPTSPLGHEYVKDISMEAIHGAGNFGTITIIAFSVEKNEHNTLSGYLQASCPGGVMIEGNYAFSYQ